ncbi:MAG: hypothetical protein Q9225_007553, partial [Loekoesia sp. 1 TL-2023]
MSTSSPSTLSPPSTFDILPPLHSILSRLLLPPANTSPNATPTPASSFPSQLTTISLPNGPHDSNLPNGLNGPNSNDGPLNPKDLAAAVSE